MAATSATRAAPGSGVRPSWQARSLSSLSDRPGATPATVRSAAATASRSGPLNAKTSARGTRGTDQVASGDGRCSDSPAPGPLP